MGAPRPLPSVAGAKTKNFPSLILDFRREVWGEPTKNGKEIFGFASPLAYIPTGMYNEAMHQNPQTKEKLLNAAQKLMLEKGFTATSVEDICKVAGVTKGSFFHYFTNKEDLGKAVAQYYWQTMRAAWNDAPFRKHSDPLKRVCGFIDFFVALSEDRSVEQRCLLGNFAQELSDTNPSIRNVCAACFTEWAEDLKKDLDAAKEKYLSKKHCDTKSVAEYIVATMEGSLLLAKAHRDRSINTRNLKHLKRYVESIFEGK